MTSQREQQLLKYLKPDDLLLGVSRKGVESFAACLTLGTLQAMRDGKLDTEIGIWTLGRLVFGQS